MGMVNHARRELELLGEDPDIIEWFLKVIGTYASFGHSGGSHAACLPVLIDLLNQKNLTPLTDDPKEWVRHAKDVFPPDGVWQNVRNSEAFSNDGGKTYYLLSEGGSNSHRKPLHKAVAHG